MTVHVDGCKPPGSSFLAQEATYEECSCGSAFHDDASFCIRCGARRPHAGKLYFASFAEMLSMADGLQTGAAQGVFDAVKSALDTAARSAAEHVNDNMRKIMCAMAGSGSISAVEAIGDFKSVCIGDASFTGHVGHHSHTHTICHLLHLAVQLALFPRGPVANFAGQAGCPFSSLIDRAQHFVPTPTLEAACQVDPPPPPPPPKKHGPYVGVRIGGGYHLFNAPDNESEDGDKMSTFGSTLPSERPSTAGTRSETFPGPPRCASPPPTSPRGKQKRPLLEDIAAETVRLSASPRAHSPSGQRHWPDTPTDPETTGRPSLGRPASGRATNGEPLCELTRKSPYEFGARSDAVPMEKYRVAAFSQEQRETTMLSNKEMTRHRDGEGVFLSRYLGQSPKPLRSGDRRSRPDGERRPMSSPGRPMSSPGGRARRDNSSTPRVGSPAHALSGHPVLGGTGPGVNAKHRLSAAPD